MESIIKDSKIMIIDDQPANLSILFEYLDNLGAEVMLIQEGHKATGLAETKKPDIILLDIIMPELSGFDVCKKLKDNDKTADIPVIFMSVLTEPEDIVKGFEYGGVDYVAKPVRKEEVIARISTHLKIRRTEEELILYRNHLEKIVEKRTAELEETNRKLETEIKEKAIMNEIAGIFLTLPDEHMYSEVLNVVLREMKSKYGIFGFIGNQGELIIPSMTGEIWTDCHLPEKSKVFPSTLWGNSVWGSSIREKKSFYSDGPFHTPPGHVTIKNFLTVPIVFGNESIGQISVANKQSGYNENDRNLLERIAKKISPILKARLERDIQERKRMEAEETLKESEQKYRLLVSNAGEAIFIVQDEKVKFPNRKTMDMTGYTEEELAEISLDILVHPEDRETVINRYFVPIEGEHPYRLFPFRITDKNDKELWVQLTTAGIIWDEKPGILCFLKNITEEKNLEARLIHAQKMDAVGRLAGGIAHDFNNILSIIYTISELAMDSLHREDPLKETFKEILKTVDRGASLTHQILAFSRNQLTVPVVIELNSLIAGMEKMLRRLIREDIELITFLPENLWRIKADRGNIEQIIMNLVVNARDAMPDGGKLTIETSNIQIDEQYVIKHLNITAGPYVTLAVTDTGCGMDQDTISKVFEPFFTTKEQGKGTGLGLSIVYGIVKQSGGNIRVCSEPGKGTTFKLYFPRIDEEPIINEPFQARDLYGMNQTVLVVEDEEALRNSIVKILEQKQYRVITAPNGMEAISLCEQYHNNIDLLVTDVIMPHMGGTELAKYLAQTHPDMKVIYMSGYTDNSILQKGLLKLETNFLQKPFKADELLAKIREMLKKKS